MKATPPTLVRTLGALLAVAVVLAVAVSYLENKGSPGSGQTASTMARLIFPEASPSVGTAYAVLASRDKSAGARRRLAVDIMLNASATPDQADQALSDAARALRQRSPDLAAITITAFKVDPRADNARRAVARLVWSPDGKGWDGVSRGSFAQHIFREAAPAQ